VLYNCITMHRAKKNIKKVFIHVDISIILRFLKFGFQNIRDSTVVQLLHREMSTF